MGAGWCAATSLASLELDRKAAPMTRRPDSRPPSAPSHLMTGEQMFHDTIHTQGCNQDTT